MTNRTRSHEAADTTPEDGSLARKGRAIQTIKDILGLDDQAYGAHVDSLTEVEKVALNVEINRYITTCSVMQERYLQWSSQLLLDAPKADQASNLRRSSLIAPTGAVLLKALEDNPSIHIPQNLRDSAHKISALAAHKQEFLERLRMQLRPDELATYGEILRIIRPPLSAMPDIALLGVFEAAIDLWKRFASQFVHPDHGLADSEINEWTRFQHQRATRMSTLRLRSLTSAGPRKEDSLAARLMLASMVNRTLWELLEYERFSHSSREGLCRLATVLRCAGNDRVPIELSRKDFEQWLLTALSSHSARIEARWRSLKPSHMRRFYTQAEWTLYWERANGVAHRESHDELLNMSVLLMSWNFCTYEKHDMRVPNVKEYDLVNGRDIADESHVTLTRIMYHQRQLNTMIRSHQHFELSTTRLEIYTTTNLDARRELMKFIRSSLAGLTLTEWMMLNPANGKPAHA